MSAALNNPMQFVQRTPEQQIQEFVRQQVFTTMQQMEQQQADTQFDTALSEETRLLDQAIKGNPRLSAVFKGHSFDDAIDGKAGPQVQALASKIDDALGQAAAAKPDATGSAVPLSNPSAIAAAMLEGVKSFATTDGQSSTKAMQFASDVVSGQEAADNSETRGENADADDSASESTYDDGRIADSSFDDIDPIRVQDHFKASVESQGGIFDEPEPTILETAPEIGSEPDGFYN